MSLALVAGLGAPAQAFAPMTLPGSPAGVSELIGELGARPGATRIPVSLTDHVSASVDVGTGNLLTSVNVVSLPGINGDIAISLAHNSLNEEATGPSTIRGWQLSIGGAGNLSETPEGVLWTGGDGYTALFTPVAGSDTEFTSPAGVKMDLVATQHNHYLTSRTTGATVTFNHWGEPESIADRNDNKTTISYANGHVSQVVSTRGSEGARTLTVGKDHLGDWTFSRTSEGELRSMVVKTFDNALTFQDSEGVVTEFKFDEGQRLTEIHAPVVAPVYFTYDGQNRDTKMIRSDGSEDSVTRFDYTDGSRTLMARPTTDLNQPVSAVPTVTYSLTDNDLVAGVRDEMGRERSRTYTADADVESATSGTGATAGTTTNVFEANNGQSVTSSTRPGGAVGSAEYENTAASSAYLPTSTTNDAGNTSLYTYNGAGNALSTTDALAAEAALTYNDDGTVATATAPDNTGSTTYSYDENKQLIRVTPPDGSSLEAKSFTYNDWGQVETITDGNGETTSYSYDNIGRLLATDYANRGDIFNEYDPAGRLTGRVTVGTGYTSFVYDGLNRLVKRELLAVGASVEYDYDAASNLVATTDSRGTTEYEFDASGTPTKLLYGTAADTEVMEFATDDQGRRTDTWMNVSADRTQWSAHQKTSYDTSGRITGVTSRTGTGEASNTIVQNRTYCYQANTTPATGCTPSPANDRSKIQWMSDNVHGSDTVYTYDQAGRLTEAAVTGGDSPTTYAYAYDSRGNRTEATVNGAATTTTHNAGNQITNDGYLFDGNGNLLQDTEGTYRYDSAQNMVAVTKDGETYDSVYAGGNQHELITQDAPDAFYEYAYGRANSVGLPIVEKVTKNGVAAYVESDPVTGEPLILRTADGSASMYINDATGNPEALLANTGEEAVSLEYDPFGVPDITKVTNEEVIDTNPFLFKQGIQDRTTGWVKYGARWYNPNTGTWTQQDTLDAPLDPLNANRYAFAANDPINNSDPLGLYSFSDGAGDCAEGAATGGAVTVGLGTSLGPAGLAGSLAVSCGLGILTGWGADALTDNEEDRRRVNDGIGYIGLLGDVAKIGQALL